MLSSDDLQASPMVMKESDFVKPLALTMTATGVTFELPAHAIVFVHLVKQAAKP